MIIIAYKWKKGNRDGKILTIQLLWNMLYVKDRRFADPLKLWGKQRRSTALYELEVERQVGDL